ncbi:DUF3040 domain-containing protein [Streptomonospora wellingtoniae]|uniref:DUF3040 domain-containing protein n=1 Tax=Streptomonospora wellingtoniae TaxID=3075544 RepID=A0ABU2KTZ5_9ACTN|nr:DUF3040 domain-containing protein [Streptomonospora sp. DSM 45055]MDT0302543.1 DUF3040 domain-containing protein [Streptomonospora sp. DSM 45055]
MALERGERAKLDRIGRNLAREDPECRRRLREYSDRLARNAGEADREPAPWAAVLVVWAAVLTSALILLAATVGAD